MSRSGGFNGLKRESWRPPAAQPTSSWAPTRPKEDRQSAEQAGPSTLPANPTYIPAGPSRPSDNGYRKAPQNTTSDSRHGQAEPDSDKVRRRGSIHDSDDHRKQDDRHVRDDGESSNWNVKRVGYQRPNESRERDYDDGRGTGRKDSEKDLRGAARSNKPESSTSWRNYKPPSDDDNGDDHRRDRRYGRDHDRRRRGSESPERQDYRSRKDAQGDNGREARHSYRRPSPPVRRVHRSPQTTAASRNRRPSPDYGDTVSRRDRRDERNRRPSPVYDDAFNRSPRRRDRSVDSSVTPRRRLSASPTPSRRKSRSPVDRKRAVPSPGPANASKRPREASPPRHSPRRARSPDSRSPERPSYRYNRKPSASPPRQQHPPTFPRGRPATPPLPSATPTPNRSPNPHHHRHDSQQARTRPPGPPFGGWGRTGPQSEPPSGPRADHPQAPADSIQQLHAAYPSHQEGAPQQYVQQEQYAGAQRNGGHFRPPSQIPPWPNSLQGLPPFPPAQTIVPAAAEPIKIDFGGATSPVKSTGGWKRIAPPPKRNGMQQFFEESSSPGPSKPNSPHRSRPASPPVVEKRPNEQSPSPKSGPPLQQPHVYLDLIEANEREYNTHLSTIAPYIQAAFSQWYAQEAPPDLPQFLVHYFGRRPSEREVLQMERLLGMRTQLSKDQEELKLLHAQALELRNTRSSIDSQSRDIGHWSPPRGPRKSLSPVKSQRVTPSQDHLSAAAERNGTNSTGAQSGHSNRPRTPPTVPPPQAARPPTPPLPPPTPPLAAPSPVITPAVPAAKPAVRKLPPGETYERLECVGEGTYGKVYKARDFNTGTLVALKRIRMEIEKDGFPVTAMREIKLLQGLKHRNILRLVEMMVSKGSVYMVLEYMDHDLTGLLGHPEITFTLGNLKSLNHQMLSGLAYLHDQGILHRDLKGSNILLNASGELKLADFGLARLYSKKRKADYTNRVITLWYRGPELLLGETSYGAEVDMWSAGCIMLELFCKKPVFQGNDEIHQLEVIYSVMGTPSQANWPGVNDLPWYELVKPKEAIASKFRDAFVKWLSPAALDLAEGLLLFDPVRRLTAAEALKTTYFTTEEPGMEMPTQLANCGEHHEMSAKLERHRRRQEGK